MGVMGYNPYFTEGEKTVSFEIYDDISVPDRVISPVGTGAFVVAVWKGFRELKDFGVISEIPKMTISQAEGFSPIVDALESNFKKISEPKLLPMLDLGQETMKKTGKLITDMDRTKTISKFMGTGKKLFKESQKTFKKTTKMLSKYDKMKAIQKTTEVLSDIDKKAKQKMQYETGDLAHAIAFDDSLCLDLAKRAVESTNGFGETVNNSEIMDAFSLLGTEGIYADYASASTLAALIKLKHKGVIKNNERIVLLLTAHGLKNF
jgi:threonine synthase